MLPVAKSIFLFPISTTFIIFNNIILFDELQYISLTFYINIALMPKRMTYIFFEFGFTGKRKDLKREQQVFFTETVQLCKVFVPFFDTFCLSCYTNFGAVAFGRRLSPAPEMG